MKYIILVRHGEADRGLTKRGRKQAHDVAELLIPILQEHHVLILNSTAPKARWTANIIGAMMDRETQDEKNLTHVGDYVYKQVTETIKGLNEGREGKLSGVILVTHKPLCSEFPNSYGLSEFGKRLGSFSLDNGEGLIIDCESQTMEKLA